MHFILSEKRSQRQPSRPKMAGEHIVISLIGMSVCLMKILGGVSKTAASHLGASVYSKWATGKNPVKGGDFGSRLGSQLASQGDHKMEARSEKGEGRDITWLQFSFPKENVWWMSPVLRRNIYFLGGCSSPVRSWGCQIPPLLLAAGLFFRRLGLSLRRQSEEALSLDLWVLLLGDIVMKWGLKERREKTLELLGES